MSQGPPPHPIHSPAGAIPMTPTDLSVNSYYPEPPSDLTGGLPINLDSLRDGPPGSKPFYPYSTLIRYAIKGSPSQKLLLEDIYYAIESRFPYFRTAPAGWKNSVRHNLSLNPCFEKVPRPLTDRGKGSYWTVNDNVDPRTGVHRVRKKRPGKSKSNSDDLDVDYAPEEPNGSSSAGALKSPGFESPVTAHPFSEHEHPFAQPQVPLPEMDEHGNIIWRAAWKNELTKLETLTAEQDKLLAEPEWYREMLFRVRTAMMAPIDQNGVLQMATSVYTQLDGQHSMHNHHHQGHHEEEQE